MKKLFWPFLAVQLFLPVCMILGYFLKRPFELAVPGVTVTAFGILTVYITIKLRKPEPDGRLIFCLPLTILNAAFLLNQGVMGGIAAFLCVGSGWMLMKKVPHRWYFWVIYGLCALACAGLVLILPLWGFVQVMRQEHVVQSLPSPEGGYTATVMISDQGALGGDTWVEVRDEKRSIHILLGRFADSRVLWRGEFHYAQGMDLLWEEEEILNINGVSYRVSGEEVPLLAAVCQSLQTSLVRGGVLRSWETHGGFHGDGETYVEVCGSSEIPDSPFWHPLPAPEVFRKLAANCRDDNDACVIPEITEGYWYFRNRHPECTDPAAMEDYGSWNYTLAVYDSVRQILYYYELDT